MSKTCKNLPHTIYLKNYFLSFKNNHILSHIVTQGEKTPTLKMWSRRIPETLTWHLYNQNYFYNTEMSLSFLLSSLGVYI